MARSYGGSRPLTERAGFLWAAAAVTAVLVFIAAVLVLRTLVPDSGTSAGEDLTTTSTDTTASTLAVPLSVELFENPVLCEGATRDIGRIFGAEPGEVVVLALAAGADPTADIITLGGADRVADTNGDYTLSWSCQPEQAGQRWEVIATGSDSARTVAFALDGAEPPVAQEELAVTLLATTFGCDGQTRPLGTITGADPGETIDFSSEQAQSIRSGTADGTGTLNINWNCGPDEASKVWTVVATGATSGRAGTFTFSGAAGDAAATTTTAAGATTTAATTADSTTATTAESTSTSTTTSTSTSTTTTSTTGTDPSTSSTDATTSSSAPGALEIVITEERFACDGGARPFARLSGLDAGETVNFSSPQAGDIRPGTAEGDGSLTVNWQCSSEEIGTTWVITATGATSGRSLEFSFEGVAPG